MNDRRDDDQFDELMRRALSEEAGRIEPADGLHEIQARVRDQRRPVSRRPWVITAGAAVVGAAAAVAAFAVLNGTSNTADDEPTIAGSAETSTTPSPGPASTPAVTPKVTPQPAPTEASTARPSTVPTDGRGVEEPVVKDQKAVPVYWLGEKVGARTEAFRLYRTFARVSGRPALEAVRLMTTPKAANDPDYTTPWAGATVSSVRYTDDQITVDFEQLPGTKLEPEVADVAAQQLVYTVQGVLKKPSVPVQITERGRTASGLFGAIDTSRALRRAPTLNVQALIWIESPENGQTVKPSFTVTGTAAVFEAQVDWKATNLKTKEVVKNYTMTSEGQKFSPYSFTPKLTEGEWLIEVYTASPEDGRVTDVDSKTVYVK
ncbi:Gmad2 immunoglobulin-like domain-containing protein [Kribbella sp. NPDC023855]|uniref:Gmad2 immunoglobulin-like domain-containing protein n=1 Tax=Kribbella sp. NPDC023855 TaxID=3154698 RepID=UPI0034043521